MENQSKKQTKKRYCSTEQAQHNIIMQDNVLEDNNFQFHNPAVYILPCSKIPSFYKNIVFPNDDTSSSVKFAATTSSTSSKAIALTSPTTSPPPPIATTARIQSFIDNISFRYIDNVQGTDFTGDYSNVVIPSIEEEDGSGVIDAQLVLNQR